MKENHGRKLGWIGGWSGSFFWLFLLSVIWFINGRFFDGLFGITLFAFSLVIIFTFAPWRHPSTPYWKLFLPIISLLVVSIGLCLFLEERLSMVGGNPASIWWISPLILTVVGMGNCCWNDPT